MKHFYGYNRSDKDAPDGVDRIWLDDDTTHRQEREDMMRLIEPDKDGSWPDRFDVFIVDTADLGRGAEVKGIRDAIIAGGNRLHVIEREVIPETRGRPAQFNPTPEADKKIKRLYHSFQAMRYVLGRASEIAGMKVKAHHLKRRYGNRWTDNTKEGK